MSQDAVSAETDYCEIYAKLAKFAQLFSGQCVAAKTNALTVTSVSALHLDKTKITASPHTTDTDHTDLAQV